LGKGLFDLKLIKSKGHIVAEIKGLDNTVFGFKAQVTQLHAFGRSPVKTSGEGTRLLDSKHTIIFEKLQAGTFSLGRLKICLKMVLCDFEIVCEDKAIPAFKATLVQHSRVFERMLQNQNWLESKNNMMLIEDFDTATVENLVYFLNFGKLPEMPKCSNFELLLIADKYEILDLIKFCQNKQASDLNLNNCFQILDMTTFVTARPLQDAALAFIFENWLILSSTQSLAVHRHKKLFIHFCFKHWDDIDSQKNYTRRPASSIRTWHSKCTICTMLRKLLRKQ
jgi:hypothetical protein